MGMKAWAIPLSRAGSIIIFCKFFTNEMTITFFKYKQDDIPETIVK